MNENETLIADNAKTESKPTVARKTAKRKSKAKNQTRKDTHGGRPRLFSSYWIEVLKDQKLRGKDRADAIRELERCQKEEARKKLAKSASNPEHAVKLRGLLQRAAERQSPVESVKVESKPIARSAKPQAEEVAPIEVTDALEAAPLTFDDVMAQIAEQSKKSESVADIAKRLCDEPAPGYDSATETRIWAAVHGMKVR